MVIGRLRTFFSTEYLRVAQGRVEPMTLPEKVQLHGISCGELLFRIRQDWRVGEHTFSAGALLSMPLGSVTEAAPPVRTVLVPGPRETIEQVAVTAGGVLVACYSNVVGRLLRLQFDGAAWTALDLGLPAQGSVGIVTADERSDTAFVTYENFLQPTTLYEVGVAGGRVRPVKALAAKFEADGCSVEQLHATSRDGTAVPYFVVRPAGFVADGAAPTLLYGYGGFDVSLLPTYLGTTGKLWLEQGGVYVLATSRGRRSFGGRTRRA